MLRCRCQFWHKIPAKSNKSRTIFARNFFSETDVQLHKTEVGTWCANNSNNENQSKNGRCKAALVLFVFAKNSRAALTLFRHFACQMRKKHHSVSCKEPRKSNKVLQKTSHIVHQSILNNWEVFKLFHGSVQKVQVGNTHFRLMWGMTKHVAKTKPTKAKNGGKSGKQPEQVRNDVKNTVQQQNRPPPSPQCDFPGGEECEKNEKCDAASHVFFRVFRAKSHENRTKIRLWSFFL